MSKFNIAVVGATGNVGREILSILNERNFPVKKIFALASKKSEGKRIDFGSKKIKVQSLETFNFKNSDIVLSSAGSAISESFIKKASDSGAITIDNTSCFRMNKDVPLIVPEVNVKEISKWKKKKIISNPNCSTIQLVTALKPIHDAFKIKRIIVSTYQSTSGAGKKAMDELFYQTLDVYKNKNLKSDIFSKQIAFNVIPQIDIFLDDGKTKEEWKLIEETKKILDNKIKVFATCVRVPVFIGHALSVNIETQSSINEKKLNKVMEEFEGINVIDNPSNNEYVTPDEIAGKDEVFVSRLRKDDSVKNGISLWIVADNLRKGAALNTVQIAEELIKMKIK
tara:strand:+ start:5069 stop:6085 length:1017 start_codon:yes stop_codon:yes gene_type:complete